MKPDELREAVLKSLPNAEVSVEGDGRHFEVLVISDEFSDISLLERQRLVNKAVQNHIFDGSLHAIQIKAYTKAEAKEKNG